MKRTFRLRIDGQEVDVGVERAGNTLLVERGDEQFTVEVVDTGRAGGGAPARPDTAGTRRASPETTPAAPEAASISIPHRASVPSGARVEGSVVAPMTGVIKEVLVGSGDSVATGETIIIMESMKMDIVVSAPRSGTVADLFVTVGDSVREQQAILRIE